VLVRVGPAYPVPLSLRIAVGLLATFGLRRLRQTKYAYDFRRSQLFSNGSTTSTFNECKIAPIRRLTEPALHVAVPGHEKTSTIRFVLDSQKDVDRDLIRNGSSKVGAADIPWTHIDRPHMNRRWRRAISSHKNVILPRVTAHQLRIETAPRQFVHHQAHAHLAGDKARPARLLASVLSDRAHQAKAHAGAQASDVTGISRGNHPIRWTPPST